MPAISKRAQNMQASPIRELASIADQIEDSGIKVYRLSIGQPDLPTNPIFINTINSVKNQTISYAPSKGMPEALSAWQKYYHDIGLNFSKEEIVITSGGSEAIIFALSIVGDADNEIIVFEPYYTNYNGFATITNVKLKSVTLDINNGFHLPPDENIISAITVNTKAILICNPSNPTGVVYTREELQRLVNIAKKYNLFILSDEVYREFVYEKEAISLMSFPEIEDLVILLDSSSKRFNVCGARVGCIVSRNKNVIKTALKYAMARLSAAMLDQLALVPMLENAKKYTSEIVQEFRQRREIVYEELKKIPGITCFKPEGAFYIIIGLPVKSAEKFTKWLLTDFNDQKETVLISPATRFYVTPNKGINEVRLAFVLSSNKLKRSIQILKHALELYKD